VGIAERIYEVVKSLPEAAAAEVLRYAESMRAGLADKGEGERRTTALSVVSNGPGSLRVVKVVRCEIKDR
jgi:hypothetical protein